MAGGLNGRRIGGAVRGRELLEERRELAEIGRIRQRFRVDAGEGGLEGADFGAEGDAAQGGREGDDAQELRETVIIVAGEEKKTGGIGGWEAVEERGKAEGLLGRPRRARTAERALGSDELRVTSDERAREPRGVAEGGEGPGEGADAGPEGTGGESTGLSEAQ